MTDFDWKSLVRNVAPTLGAALGGPLAGAATKFLADAFLGNPDANEQDVAAAVLGASPEKLLELKKMDLEFKSKMRELDVDVFKLEISDKQSARDLAKVNMMPHIVLSSIYTVGYFAMLYQFMTGGVEVAEGLKAEFNMILGVMTAAQVKIMEFWLGSSYGSKVKDATIAAG